MTRYAHFFTLLFALAIFTAGCNKPAPSASDQTSSTAAPAAASATEAPGPGDALPSDNSADTSAPPPAAAPAPTAEASPAPAPAPAPDASADYDTEPEADYFYDQLSPYGQWVTVANYGPCWEPYNVAPDWRPYSLGHWVYTDDDGWLWVSDEPFGWACYHYGRWTLLAGGTWCWVPGRVWGPAWVCWRNGGGYVGWCPLPPGAGGVAVTADIDPFAFCFVDARFIDDVHIHDHLEPVSRNVTFIHYTKDITHFDRVGGRFVDRGFDIKDAEKAVGHSIDRVKVTDSHDARSAQVSGHEVSVYRPQLPARPAARAAQSRFEPEPARGSAAAPANAARDNGADAARAQRDAYYQKMQTDMQARQQQEMQTPPAGRSAQDVKADQAAEQRAFEEHQRAAPAAPPQAIRRREGGNGH